MCALSVSPAVPPTALSRLGARHGGDVSRAYARVLDQTLAYGQRPHA
jgi:hypothetical protein